MRLGPDRRRLSLLAIAVLAGLAGCRGAGGGADEERADSGSTTRPALAAAPERPAQPMNVQLTARRGGVVATVNDWQLRYEGTISDGRPRFLESVSNGEQKDVVFDPSRSRAYPFGDVAIEILRSTPELLVYRIRSAD